MAARLYALGRWAVAHRRVVAGTWLLVLVVLGGLGGALHGKLSSVFTVPGIESQRAQDLLQHRFPLAAGGTARIVFAAPAGRTVADEAPAVAASLKAAAKVPGAVVVTPPTTSADKTVEYADVIFRQLAQNVPASAKDALTTAVAPARAAGLHVEFGGTAEQAVGEVGGPGEVVGVVVAFVVLAVALGALLPAGLPLLTALIGVGIGVAGVELVSRFAVLTNTATVLATMIGLAVGIDYALFIVSRHREQLADPDVSVDDSIGRAVGTAGSAVCFAGVTVVIALAALSVSGIPFLSVMGLAAAATVAVAVLVAVTLVPALLGFAGERLRPGRRRSRLGLGRRPTGVWGRRWAHGVERAPAAVLVGGVVVLLVLASPARHLRLGLPSNETQPASTTQHRSYELLTGAFGPGFNATLAVVVDGARIPADRRTPTVTALAATVRADPDIAQVGAPLANPDGTVTVLTVVPRTGPDAAATESLVHRLRDRDEAAVRAAGGTMYVAGATAANIDVSAKLAGALPLFVVIIVVLAFLLLSIAFRSLLVPLTAVLGFLLSVAAALGVVVWVFQFGHLGSVFGVAAAAPIVSFVPVLLIGVLFGLAMDYEVFLVSRMREGYERDRLPAGQAVSVGVERSGRVVSAAALIMAAVFAGFVVTHDPIIKSIAFSLTVGVLVDAFLVRLTLIPAVMALLGRYAWALPRWIDRALPNVDIEGVSLPAPRRPDPVESGRPTVSRR